MESTVDDFLSEINKIAPISSAKSSSDNNVWEKCFDENSGYPYYWNTKTDEVTWDKPSGFKSPKHKNEKNSGRSLYMPPRVAPLFPSTSQMPDVRDSVKIYKIAESVNIKKENSKKKEEEFKFTKNQQFRKHQIDSDERKVVLISAYTGDSNSEESEDEKDDKNDRKEEINGLKRTLNDDLHKTKDSQNKSKSSDSNSKQISGFSLVAGYESTSEGEDQDESEEKKEVSHSTLFPIVKPINVEDFETKPEDKSDFDTKAFKRKRRIGIDFANSPNQQIKLNDETRDENDERRGFGFSEKDKNDNDNENKTNKTNNIYPGFKSGGLLFVKSDVLNPANENKEKEILGNDIEETYTTFKEKLGFLSDGKEAVSPVQAMLIQIETLMTAAKAGDLKQSYLKRWLGDTCSDLVKLEKETTPTGWLLQWDRHHKRYYYQNEATGESQWEYPQIDVTRRDEAMDICTTPPPSHSVVERELSPPLPPKIRSPTPPPPPNISGISNNNNSKKCDIIPLPPEPSNNGEPLPPGVDINEVPQSNNKKCDADLHDELNSFYSDIAVIETTSSPPPPAEDKTENDLSDAKKKKPKSKVKLTQGIAMKKKGVSKLVEKWKNVQMSYKD